MLTQQQILIYRSIKKSAVILLALGHIGKALKAADLCTMLDISPKTMRQMLTSMQALGLVSRLPDNTYTLTRAAQTLLFFDPAREKISPSTTSNVNPQLNFTLDAELVLPKRAENPSASTPPKNQAHNSPNEELVQALKKAGIREPVRSQLARISYLTPKHVTRYEDQLKREAGERYTPGLLIYTLKRLQPDDPIPPCTCGVCSECLARYTKYETTLNGLEK